MSLWADGKACEAEVWDETGHPMDVFTYKLCELKVIKLQEDDIFLPHTFRQKMRDIEILQKEGLATPPETSNDLDTTIALKANRASTSFFL